MMKLYTYCLTLLGIMLLSACHQQTVYDKNENIAGKQWLYSDSKSFDVHITDLTKKYKVYITLRHTADYPYSNIFVRFKQVNPDGKETSERRELKLAELDGKWTGKSAGSLYAQQQIIHDSYTFPDTGIYHFNIEQNMRDNPLKEIIDVGLYIKEK